MLGGVSTCQNEPARLQALFPRFLERDFGIGSERQLVFLAVCLAELEAPDSQSARGHLEEESATIEQLYDFAFGLAFLTCVSDRGTIILLMLVSLANALKTTLDQALAALLSEWGPTNPYLSPQKKSACEWLRLDRSRNRKTKKPL